MEYAIRVGPSIMMGLGALYGIVGAFFALFSTWLYNGIAYLVGGIEYRLKGEGKAATPEALAGPSPAGDPLIEDAVPHGGSESPHKTPIVRKGSHE